jgi:hypothetical protein
MSCPWERARQEQSLPPYCFGADPARAGPHIQIVRGAKIIVVTIEYTITKPRYDPVIFTACDFVTLIHNINPPNETSPATQHAISAPAMLGTALEMTLNVNVATSAITKIFQRASVAALSEKMDTNM